MHDRGTRNFSKIACFRRDLGTNVERALTDHRLSEAPSVQLYRIVCPPLPSAYASKDRQKADPPVCMTLVCTPGIPEREACMVTYIRSDLEFILQQILIAEQHAAGSDPATLVPNSFVPFGLRTVDGSFNNIFPGQSEFGASDNLFARMLDPAFRTAEAGTSYAQTSGFVFDSQPRTISNLIVDQTSSNPAAVAVAGSAGADGLWGTSDDVLNDGVSITDLRAGQDGIVGTADDIAEFSFANVTPDEGLSAPFNLWFVFFGQFFDHGLDLVQKGGNGTVFIPLQADDPLIAGPDGILGNADDLPPELQFMVLTRATQVSGPGADGILGDDPTTVGVDESLDDTTHEAVNTTTPFVDQNQTYTSHPSHQVFLRAYEFDAAGRPGATGKLITNRDLVDGEFGNGNDIDLGGMATWATVKAQARDLLGIQLTDYDAVNVPMIRVDPYGNFIPGSNGFAQLVIGLGADGIAQTADDVLLEGDPAADGGLGVSTATALRTGHMFLADIAHSANPFNSQTGTPLAPDSDSAAGRTLHGGRWARQREYRPDSRPPRLPCRAQSPRRPHQECSAVRCRGHACRRRNAS